jgi:hypothetical protein
MTASEISRIIEDEIGDGWSRSNAHGVDLKQCLVTPVEQVYEDSFKEGQTIMLWLVLEERPADKGGYKIVFEEESRMFGLAVSNVARERDLFLGLYGTFLETLEGM